MRDGSIAINKLLPARADYDFGYMTPIYRGVVKDMKHVVEALDQGHLPTLLKEKLGTIHEHLNLEVELRLSEQSHIWILVTPKGDFMLRKVRRDLRIYDMVDTVAHKFPSLTQVAEWHDLNRREMTRIAAVEKWFDNRNNRLRDMDEESTAIARSEANAAYLKSAKSQIATLQKMQDLYNQDLALGTAKVTSRDVIAVIGIKHRIEKDLTTIGTKEDPVRDFVKALLESGLAKPAETPTVGASAEIVESADYEVIDDQEELEK